MQLLPAGLVITCKKCGGLGSTSRITERCISGNESPEGAGKPVHQPNATQAEREARDSHRADTED